MDRKAISKVEQRRGRIRYEEKRVDEEAAAVPSRGIVSFFISAVSPTGNEKRFDQREQSASDQYTSTWESVRARQDAADMKF
jgi:hypothetical protein